MEKESRIGTCLGLENLGNCAIWGMSDLQIHKMELGPIGTNAFLLWEDGKQDAVLIDIPPMSKHEIECFGRQRAKNYSNLAAHGTGIHGWDLGICREGVEVIGHRADEIMFRDPGIMSGFSVPGMELKPFAITRWVEDGGEMELWGRKVKFCIAQDTVQAM